MKLRRAMALAAATAVIAPAAFLAAPAAYADGDPATTTQTETTDPDGSTGSDRTDTETPESDPAGEPDPDDAENPEPDPATDPVTDTEDGTGKDPAGDTDPDADPATDPGADEDPAGDTDPEGEEDPADGTDPATDPDAEEDPADGTDPGDEPGTKPDEDPATDPEDEFEACEPVIDEDGDLIDAASALRLDINGLPGRIVAGSGWHNFRMTASNTTDEALGEVRWIAFVDNYSESDNENDWLSNHLQLQYLDQGTKTWKSIEDEEFMGRTELGAKDVVDIQLRVNIDAKAPSGDSFALGLGAYLDSDEECYRSALGYWEFSVLAPGSDNENPGKPKPVEPPVEKPVVSPKEPQGGAKEIPVTGSLAETGSSSAMPMFALAGGAAVALGVGAMFVVRRRKAGSEA
ncbi:LAETG motif-containing sortase-dependent surface protein [Streptomyces sp. Wb2n-11]|uniref:LAETG motif-containing sortase-dependent surface protein n=1 Tax=Streptomyces sp. Wb2n-11 TaxID=1030533 RepID=UPI0021004562|nr:LAETG motif-containing sortase-dependent surface protein [Streptomyces sp. Wb2n-11]